MSGSDWDVYVTCDGRILGKDDNLKSCGVRDGSTVQVMSRMRGGGKHEVKKGNEEKQVAQLDDGMCAMACEQLRLPTEGMSQGPTEEDRRRISGGIENARKVLAVVEEKVKGEDVRRVAELKESLKKLEEEEVRLVRGEQQEVTRSIEQKSEEKVTREGGVGKGEGKGIGGKGEHANTGRKFRRKGAAKRVNADDEAEADDEKEGTRKPRWADCEEGEEKARQGAAEGDWHKARKKQGIMWLDGRDQLEEKVKGVRCGRRQQVDEWRCRAKRGKSKEDAASKESKESKASKEDKESEERRWRKRRGERSRRWRKRRGERRRRERMRREERGQRRAQEERERSECSGRCEFSAR